MGEIKRIVEGWIIKAGGGYKESLFARKVAERNYKVSIGLYTYGSCFDSTFNTGGTKVSIGRYCSFGPNVRYFGANHPMSYGCMSPYFYRKEWGFDVEDVNRESLVIGNDCWIGYNSTIVSSCKRIGNGAVIAAGSVVTKDVDPYTIVAGNPAVKIRNRFTEKQIEAIEASRWWELTPEELYKFYTYISDPERWAREIMDYRGLF